MDFTASVVEMLRVQGPALGILALLAAFVWFKLWPWYTKEYFPAQTELRKQAQTTQQQIAAALVELKVVYQGAAAEVGAVHDLTVALDGRFEHLQDTVDEGFREVKSNMGELRELLRRGVASAAAVRSVAAAAAAPSPSAPSAPSVGAVKPVKARRSASPSASRAVKRSGAVGRNREGKGKGKGKADVV